MRIKLVLIISVVVIFCPNSFGQNSDDESVLGVFQGEEYSNKALGFSFKVPPKWLVPTRDQLTKYTERGNKEFVTGDPNLDKKVGRPDKIEFAISKKKVDEPENPVMGYGLTKQASTSITAKMIAVVTRDYFLKVPSFRLIKDISVEPLGTREFVTFEIGFDNGSKQKVRTYMTMVGEYTITFALTYWDDKDLKVMLDSLNTIKFQSK